MKRRRATPEAQLDEVYAGLPTVECKGLCQSGCGSIGMTRLEQRRIRVRHGVQLPLMGAFAVEGRSCPALNAAGRCTVYANRPLICRLWGLTERLRCPHGCEPEGGWLPEEDARRALAKVVELSGWK